MRIHDIKIGMKESYEQTITDTDIKNYSGLSGDKNPIHMSDDYAEKSRFKRRIANGLYSAGFFSMLFGKKPPRDGCLYVSQTLSFRKPVYIGDTIKATIEVISVDEKNLGFF